MRPRACEFECLVVEVRALAVLVRGAAGGLLVLGPVMAAAPPIAAAPAPAALSAEVDTTVGDPAIEGPDPFVHWDRREQAQREREQELREAQRSADAEAEESAPGNGGDENTLAASGFDALGTAVLGLFVLAVGLGLVRLSRPRGFAAAR